MTRLDEWMDSYEPEKDMIPDIEPLGRKDKERLLHLTLEKINCKPYRGRRRIRTFLIACILILAAFTLSFAAYQYIISGSFGTFFGIQDEKQKELLNSIGTTVNKEATENGVTVRINEIIGDRHTLYILFDAVLEKSASSAYFDDSQLTFNGEMISMGWSIEQLYDENPHDNVVPFILSLDADTDMRGKEVLLTLSDLSYSDDGINDPTSPFHEIKGTWNIPFMLNYKDNSVTVAVNKKATLDNDTSVTIKNMTLSPISANIKINRNLISNVLQDHPLFTDSYHSDSLAASFQLHMKDGTTFSALKSSGNTSGGNKITINCSFDTPIDLKDVSRIEFLGVTIPMP